MIIEQNNLNSLVNRLVKKRGMSKEGAERIVHGYFNATIEVLEEGEELPLLGSNRFYIKKKGDKIMVYPK